LPKLSFRERQQSRPEGMISERGLYPVNASRERRSVKGVAA